MMNCSIFNDIGNANASQCVVSLIRALTVSLTGGTWHLIYQRKWGLRMYSAARKFALHMPYQKVCLHSLVEHMIYDYGQLWTGLRACTDADIRYYGRRFSDNNFVVSDSDAIKCSHRTTHVYNMMNEKGVEVGKEKNAFVNSLKSICVNRARAKFCAMRVRLCGLGGWDNPIGIGYLWVGRGIEHLTVLKNT